MHRIAPFSNEMSVHGDAMHWVNYFTLHIKLKANGELEYVPEFNDAYFAEWDKARKELLGCAKIEFRRSEIVNTHEDAVRIVDNAVAKTRRDESLTFAEISLLEDVYREISGCKRPYIYY